MFIFNKIYSYNTIAWVCTSCLCAMCYTQSSSRGAVGISERSEQNFITQYIHASYLAWGLYYMYSEIVQKSCQCSLGYHQSSLRRCYRSKSGGTFTTEYYQVGHQEGLRTEQNFNIEYYYTSVHFTQILLV